MILKSLKLANIRSYINQEIRFPSGSILLAGDIGSGKSSILHAIEFALFGIKRPELSGNALLRHGEREGGVELHFTIDGKDITVKRTVKRIKDDVRADSGYLILDGQKREGTAVELKSWIFELLGYPKELVSKSKDLIYRYTVYTPQEEMKQILMEDKDIRLDTMRKVFNIDKYKRIRENAQIAIRDLKERRKDYEGRIIDLEEKRKQLHQQEKEIKELDSKIKALKPVVDRLKQDANKKRGELQQLEKMADIRRQMERNREVAEVELKNKVEQEKRNEERLTIMEKQSAELEALLSKKEIENASQLQKKIKEKDAEIRALEKKRREIAAKLSECRVKKAQATEITSKIGKLDVCPLCEQNVSHEHKAAITGREDKRLQEIEAATETYSKQQKETEGKLEKAKEEFEGLRNKESESRVLQLRLQSLEEKKKEKEQLLKLQDKLKEEAERINVKKTEISDKIMALGQTQEQYLKKREEYEKLMEEEREKAIELNGVVKEKEGLQKPYMLLQNEIQEKIRIKESLTNIKQLQNWIEEHFIGLMETMERHVMVEVQREFNAHFQDWFNILIEDENLSIRLDDEFTPVVMQNGYEAWVENLSGGERTAVALAYRLALNKAINDVITPIKTKDIIMLDEPTDGFSTEQLDEVREVLDQLNMKQIIIVSHEHKIESFVENVIRVHKKEHISQIV